MIITPSPFPVNACNAAAIDGITAGPIRISSASSSRPCFAAYHSATASKYSRAGSV